MLATARHRYNIFSKGTVFCQVHQPGALPALRDRGGKIIIRGSKVFAEFLAEITNFNVFPAKSRWSQKKRSLPKSESFFWPKSQIFRPNAGDLQKIKRSLPRSEGFFWLKLTNFPTKSRWSPKKKKKKKKKGLREIRRLFLAEITNFNVFSAQKKQLLPPKKNTGEGGKKRIGG